MMVTAEPRSIFATTYPATGSGGLRVAVKDVIDMAGTVTTCGSRALARGPKAAADADVIARLRAAGYEIAGRTVLHELAYGVTGVNAWSGTPVNPAYPDLIPGGSSSGSAAAVAAGLVDAAIGTDTGGSVRLPAACCGVVGLKPSWGRVSRTGVHPAVSSLDCIGPFARDVATIETVMAAIAPDWMPVDTIADDAVGWVGADGDPALAAAVRQALVPHVELRPMPLTDMADAMKAGLAIIARENWQAFGHLTRTGLLGPDVQQRLSAAAQITDGDIAWAQGVRARFTAAVDAALERVAVLALPVLPQPVPSLAEAADPARIVPLTAHCRPFNLSGHPALALPIGERDGRPIALQLVGRRGEDERLCALARRIPLFLFGAHQ